mmetsp:Transcript_19640/g.52699  ORF Transcript_19640/g.52699 Transcript_19640/m.52699 type:complete len:225 (+) Transcript_19640:1001-1675(+)
MAGRWSEHVCDLVSNVLPAVIRLPSHVPQFDVHLARLVELTHQILQDHVETLVPIIQTANAVELRGPGQSPTGHKGHQGVILERLHLPDAPRAPVVGQLQEPPKAPHLHVDPELDGAGVDVPLEVPRRIPGALEGLGDLRHLPVLEHLERARVAAGLERVGALLHGARGHGAARRVLQGAHREVPRAPQRGHGHAAAGVAPGACARERAALEEVPRGGLQGEAC